MTTQKNAGVAARPWYRMEADTVSRSAEIFIYGPISSIAWWGDEVVANDLVQELADLDVDEITLRINSPGGSVYDGIAIMNALARHQATVTATVDGLAASAATLIMLAADEIVVGPGAELMIHDASSVVWGQAKDLRKEADSLDRISQTAAELYAHRAGGSADDWRAAMLEETWYTAAEAVEAGLADRVADLPTKAADLERTDTVDQARAARAFGWQHAGRDDAPAPYIPAARTPRPAAAADLAGMARAALAALPTPAAQVGTADPTREEGGSLMDPKIRAAFLERLGLPADADDAAMLAAYDTQREQSATPKAQALPDGVVAIDASQLEQLQADAAAGREARDAQVKAEREAAVDAAVNDGRIAPARREHWLKALEADPGSIDVLNSLAKGTVPLAAAGITGGVEESPDQDIYSMAWGNDETKEA